MKGVNSLGERYTAPAIALSLAVALGAAACGGTKANCVSPRRESKAYPGEYPKAQGSNPINWPDAIVIRTHAPKGASRIVFSYEAPGSDHWKSNDSMTPDKGSAVAFRIGPSDVEFGTQIEAPSGSELCEKPPQSTFSKHPEPFKKAREQSTGYVPDPNSWSYNKP